MENIHNEEAKEDVQKAAEDLKSRKCGAIWEKTTKNGGKKLMIYIGDKPATKYMALQNKNKRTEKDPAWQIFSM